MLHFLYMFWILFFQYAKCRKMLHFLYIFWILLFSALKMAKVFVGSKKEYVRKEKKKYKYTLRQTFRASFSGKCYIFCTCSGFFFFSTQNAGKCYIFRTCSGCFFFQHSKWQKFLGGSNKEYVRKEKKKSKYILRETFQG